MLLRMRQVLSPEQRVKLNKLHEQWETGSPPATAAASTNRKQASATEQLERAGNDTERIRS